MELIWLCLFLEDYRLLLIQTEKTDDFQKVGFLSDFVEFRKSGQHLSADSDISDL